MIERNPFEVPRIYAIADQETLGGERLPEVVATLAEAGVRWVQIRAKKATGEELYRWVESSLRLLEGGRTALWIDDRADIASLLPVFGVHVGEEDLPPEAVRRASGAARPTGAPALRIGRSTHDEDQLRRAEADPEVDVVALGPIFATRSKARPDRVVGLVQLRRLREATRKPLVAIGGIDSERAPRVLEAGADAVAMIAAFGDAASPLSDIARNARRLLAAAA